jgi:hypothetical protein
VSIIYDALKKTQQNRVSYTENLILQQPKRKYFWLLPTALITGFVLFVVVSFYIYPRIKFNTLPSDFAGASVNSIAAKTKVKTKTNIEATVSTSNKFVLNGVFLSDNVKIAMINNQSYAEGDTIDNMKVVSVEANQVRLQNSDQNILLKVAN